MLQICNSNGRWTAVCDYSWACRESSVACKHLGYSNAGILNIVIMITIYACILQWHNILIMEGPGRSLDSALTHIAALLQPVCLVAVVVHPSETIRITVTH